MHVIKYVHSEQETVNARENVIIITESAHNHRVMYGVQRLQDCQSCQSVVE